MTSYRPTIGELRQVCRKGRRDPQWISNVLWRPVSLYVTWLLLRLGVPSNGVTLVSGVAAAAGGLLLLAGGTPWLLIGAGLLELFTLLDDVDGEVGRYQSLKSGSGTTDLSGKYLDLLMHYFQGPLMYVGLGGGLYAGTGELVWLALGTMSAVGSGGFPRFVAVYSVLDDTHKAGISWAARDKTLRSIVPFHASHDSDMQYDHRFFLIPQTRQEMVYWGKQYLTFPANIHILVVSILLDVIAFPENAFFAMKTYAAFFAVILVLNTIHASRWFLQQLRSVE